MPVAINLSITLTSGEIYKLILGIPLGSETATYNLTLTDQKTPAGVASTVAEFKVKDSNNFSVTANLPEVSAGTGGPSISGGLTVTEGTVT